MLIKQALKNKISADFCNHVIDKEEAVSIGIQHFDCFGSLFHNPNRPEIFTTLVVLVMT